MIAGFDKNFNRPSFANFDLFLNNDGKIEWECNYFKENFDGVSIFTFAQDSEIKSYIEGIDEYFEEEILNYWGDMLDILLNDLFEEIKNNKFDKNIINDIKIKFESFKDKSESYKIMLGQEIDELKNKNNEYLRSIIELLPKQELADLTHFLIMIPSAKRRFSLDLNSVGGHIDVCLMSKVQFSWVDYE